MKPKIQLLDKSKKKKIINQLETQFGISNLPHLFIQTGKGKYRIYSGSLSKEEINILGKNLNIEIIGSRFGKIDKEKIRINFDAINIPEIKNKITKNILEIPDSLSQTWMKGEDIEFKNENEPNFVIIKNQDNFIGLGHNNKVFIQNYVPKERRIRK